MEIRQSGGYIQSLKNRIAHPLLSPRFGGGVLRSRSSSYQPEQPTWLFAVHSLYPENGNSYFPPALLRTCLVDVRETHSHRGFKEMGVSFAGRRQARGGSVRPTVELQPLHGLCSV